MRVKLLDPRMNSRNNQHNGYDSVKRLPFSSHFDRRRCGRERTNYKRQFRDRRLYWLDDDELDGCWRCRRAGNIRNAGAG